MIVRSTMSNRPDSLASRRTSATASNVLRSETSVSWTRASRIRNSRSGNPVRLLKRNQRAVVPDRHELDPRELREPPHRRHDDHRVTAVGGDLDRRAPRRLHVAAVLRELHDRPTEVDVDGAEPIDHVTWQRDRHRA